MTTTAVSSTMEDAQLLELGTRPGPKSDAAWRLLYGRLTPQLKRFLRRRYGLDEATAEDLVQDTFERLLRHAHRYDGSRASVWAWATTISRNLAKNLFRNRSRDPTERHQVIEAGGERNDSPWVEMNTDPRRTPNPEDDLEKGEIREAVEDAVEELPPIHSTPMRLRLKGFSYKEIAEATGLEHGTVKSRLNRARRQLRPKLREKGIDADLIG